MPSLNIYIREKTWANLLRDVGHDKRKATAKIREMVDEKYGSKRV